VPELRGRAEKLAGDLASCDRFARRSPPSAIGSRATATNSRNDQTRLARFGRRAATQAKRDREDLEAEGARAIALSRQVDSLQGLIGKMEAGVEERRESGRHRQICRARRLPAASPVRRDSRPRPAEPGIAFASAKGLLATPVNGVKIP